MRSLKDAAFLLVALLLAMTVRVSDAPDATAAAPAAHPTTASVVVPAAPVPSTPAVRGTDATGDCPFSGRAEAPARTPGDPDADPDGRTADPRTAC